MKLLNIKTLLTAVAISILFGLNTQAQAFRLGTRDLNLGIGFGMNPGRGYTTTLPPVWLSYDYGYRDDIGPGVIGLGGFMGVKSYNYRYLNEGYNYVSGLIGVRGSYHYRFIDDIHTYGGIGVGLFINSSTAVGSLPDNPVPIAQLTYSFFVGAKYYLSPSFGVFAEVGWGISAASLGVTMKL